MAAAQGQQQPDARSTRQGKEIGCAVQHHTGIHGAALGVGEVRLLDRRIHFALGSGLRRHIVRDRRLRHLVLDAVGQVLDVDGIVVFQIEGRFRRLAGLDLDRGGVRAIAAAGDGVAVLIGLALLAGQLHRELEVFVLIAHDALDVLVDFQLTGRVAVVEVVLLVAVGGLRVLGVDSGNAELAVLLDDRHPQQDGVAVVGHACAVARRLMDDVGVDAHAVVLRQLNFDLPGLVRAAGFALCVGHVADRWHIICGVNALRCVGHGTRVDRKRKGLFRRERTRVGQLVVFGEIHPGHILIRRALHLCRKGGHDADAHGQSDGKHPCEKLF